ncbi:YdcF family protein [Zoogloea sp.]|uniref:YdcF family protein n=1 Tax=Zoogloea sp. TaxID=49181 RepID=UPI002604EA1B|nr:YdcF family protein [Zoogloea sp.]MDD3353424.1 YdcF family protein [Zoogloea sp.]
MFLLKKLVSALLLPPTGPLLLIITGLVVARWRPRPGHLLAWAGVASTLALSMPTLVRPLVLPLEDVPTIGTDALQQGQAIVILAGGKRRYAPEFGGETINALTLERVRYGARLARQSGLPLLVSGGRLEGTHSEAGLMQEALSVDFGLKPRWIEEQSRDTQENALYSARILRSEGIERIILVTHAAHMQRAARAYEMAGLQVIPAPTAYLADKDTGDPGLPELPSMRASYAGWYASHEWLGRLAQWISP